MNATAPTPVVTRTLDGIGHTRPLTRSLRLLGCKIIEAEIEAKDAWAGRHDGWKPTLPGMRLQSIPHNRCRARLRYALTELRALLACAKEQTHG